MARTFQPRQIPIDVSGSVLPVTSSILLPSGTAGLIAAGVGTDGIVRYLNIDSQGSLVVTGTFSVSGSSSTTTQKVSPTSSRSRVSSLSSSFILLNENLDRAGVILFNDSPSDTFISFGATCSYAGDFTYYVTPYSTLELPQPVYTGIVSACAEVQTGSIRVTETTFLCQFSIH